MTLPSKEGIIYCYINKINGKSYVGQTIVPKNRHLRHLCDSRNESKNKTGFHSALNKYGINNFEYFILEDKVENRLLNDLEIYYIKEFNSFEDGYNLTKGGDISPMKGKHHSKEWKDLMSFKMSGINNKYFGIPLSEERRKKLSEKCPHKREVFQFSLTGDFIRSFESIVEANKHFKTKNPLKDNQISKVLKGNSSKTAFGYCWGLNDIECILPVRKERIFSEQEKYKFKNIKRKEPKKVLQYTKDNTFLKEWNSSKEASIHLNINFKGIMRCCSGERNNYMNFIWKYK